MTSKRTSFLACSLVFISSLCGLRAQTPAQSSGTAAVPSWFSHCAGENGQCTVYGPAQVIFGSAAGASPKPGGHFLTQTVTGSVLCSDATFGDADPGNSKACWYGPVAGSGTGKIVTTGGSNYPFYVQNDESWDGNQRVVVAQYNLAPGLVEAQLRQMYKTGQSHVALVIWYLPFGNSNTPSDGVVDGAFLDSSGGHLSTQNQQNLTAVLGLIKQIGFSQVTVRFAPIGAASPVSWGNTWNEATFEQDEAFIFSSRQIAETALAGSSVARMYDLGVEVGGIPHLLNSDGATYSDGQSSTYTTRLWADYVKSYGTADSYGFSIAYSFGTLTTAIAQYDAAGTRPKTYALDDYANNALWYCYQELVGAHETAKPIVLQETSYDDAGQMAAIQNELQHVPVTISYIDQWPASVSVANADASPPASYGAYGGSSATSGTIVVQPCTLQTGQTTCNTTASWSTSNATNVVLHVNGVAMPNAPNITTGTTGTATIALGLIPSSLVLSSAQGTLAAQAPANATAGSASSASTSASTQQVLDTKTVAAVDGSAPIVTVAGLGGSTDQAIWAIGSNISTSCTVQLYDPNSTAAAPIATLSSAYCASNNLSFTIPRNVLTNFSAVNLVVSNPGSHGSQPFYLAIQPVPTLAAAGVGGNANQAIWAIGTNISPVCAVQIYGPDTQSTTVLSTVTNVSCQTNSLSFVIPGFIRSNYSAIRIAVTDTDGQASATVPVQLGSS